MAAITMASSLNDVPCTSCKAKAGQGCETPSGNPANGPHAARVNAFWKAVAETEAAEREEPQVWCSEHGKDCPYGCIR